MIRRVKRGTAGILPPEAQDDLLAWLLRIIAADPVEHIVLRPDEPYEPADPAFSGR